MKIDLKEEEDLNENIDAEDYIPLRSFSILPEPLPESKTDDNNSSSPSVLEVRGQKDKEKNPSKPRRKRGKRTFKIVMSTNVVHTEKIDMDRLTEESIIIDHEYLKAFSEEE